MDGMGGLSDLPFTNGEYDGIVGDVGHFDVIDIDNNGRTARNLNVSGFLPVRTKITTREPVLEMSLKKLKL